VAKPATIDAFTNAKQGKNSSPKIDSHISGFSSSTGMTLDSFEIIDKLGKGSFGSVFLVRKRFDPSGRYFAMKVLEKYKVF